MFRLRLLSILSSIDGQEKTVTDYKLSEEEADLLKLLKDYKNIENKQDEFMAATRLRDILGTAVIHGIIREL